MYCEMQYKLIFFGRNKRKIGLVWKNFLIWNLFKIESFDSQKISSTMWVATQ